VPLDWLLPTEERGKPRSSVAASFLWLRRE